MNETVDQKRKDLAASLGELTLDIAEASEALRRLQGAANELGLALKHLRDEDIAGKGK